MLNRNSLSLKSAFLLSSIVITVLLSAPKAQSQVCQPVDVRVMAFQLKTLAQPFRAGDQICLPVRQSNNCVVDRSDLFDPGATMNFGADRGLCASTSDVRVPVIVAQDEQFVTVANFRHARRFWLAKIPKNGIQKILIDTGVFNGQANIVGAGHAEIRVVMKADSPITLVSQKNEPYYDEAKIYDFMFSADPFTAVSPEKLDPKTDRSTAISIRLISTTDRIFDQVARHDGYDRVEQVGLVLNEQQKRHFLTVALNRAVNFGYSQPYDLLHFNCVTVALKLLDEAFPPPTPQPPFEVNLANLLRLNLVVAPLREALAARRLPLENQRTTLDAETNGGAGSLERMMRAAETAEDAQKIQDQYNRK